MIYCHFCGIEIFWIMLNGKKMPYEDKHGTIIHQCPKLHNKNILVKDDHILLTKAITRISQLEKRVAELEKKPTGVNNEI